MDRKPIKKIYYTMGEVTEMFDVNPSLIRFWEQKFDILKPHKNKKGNRLFTPADLDNLRLIYHLVKEKGMTLAGAQKRIRENRTGVARDLEIIDKLQRIKAMLMEIREDLGDDSPGVIRITDEDVPFTSVDVSTEGQDDVSGVSTVLDESVVTPDEKAEVAVEVESEPEEKKLPEETKELVEEAHPSDPQKTVSAGDQELSSGAIEEEGAMPVPQDQPFDKVVQTVEESEVPRPADGCLFDLETEVAPVAVVVEDGVETEAEPQPEEPVRPRIVEQTLF